MMERPAYFYAWLPGRPNCHPVHTMRHIGMIEDMENAHVTMLCWSMMGSGALSLPFLERQIDGEVPPQLRFHGYMNEREFNAECLRRGILPYAVVYQAQGWEFPAVLDEQGKTIKEINFIRSGEAQVQYGLGEFTRDEHWELFGKKFADYFPDGLYNSDGEPVHDIWDECTTRDMYGAATHSHWVEVDGTQQTCHGMCRNNPVWRAYLKKTIEIQLHAGAHAIQLDESETPICSIGYGGCFCKDCMKLFRDDLKRRKQEGTLPAKLADTDLDAFDYGAYLRKQHVDWPNDFEHIPFSDLYWEFLVRVQNQYFREIADYARTYAREQLNRDIKISGNFSNMHLLYYPSLAAVDVCVTELRRTVFRRHNWLRLAAGYTGDMQLVLAESPYDGFMPKFTQLIKEGKADDYYRLFMMEVTAHGCAMAYPYGTWLGNATYDCFDAPSKVGLEVQQFLNAHDAWITKRSVANVLVLYGYASYMMRDFHSGQGETLVVGDREDLLSYSVAYDERASRMPFFDITQRLTQLRVAYDVQVIGDGDLVEDNLTLSSLDSYDIIVVPDLHSLTENQTKLVEACAKTKSVWVYHRYAEGNPSAQAALRASAAVWMHEEPNWEHSVNAFASGVRQAYDAVRVLDWDNENIHVQANAWEGGLCVHLLNYAFDKQAYRTLPQTVTVEVAAQNIRRIEAATLDGKPVRIDTLGVTADGLARIRVYELPAYTALVIHQQEV